MSTTIFSAIPGHPGVLQVGGHRQQVAWIPAGTFRRNDPPASITISRGFWLADTQLTQDLWQAIWGEPAPCHHVGGNLPVESVDWFQAMATAERLNQRLKGVLADLPSELEWEYACCCGEPAEQPSCLDDCAWHAGNSGGATHPVATRAANAWGLYDMLGNVWEWTADWAGPLPATEAVDPRGAREGIKRSVRGGSFSIPPQSCGPDRRGGDPPTARIRNLGFRLAFRIHR